MAFRDFIMRMRDGQCTTEDYDRILMPMFDRWTAFNGTAEWEHANRIMLRNEDAKQYNEKRMLNLGEPIVRIDAINNKRGISSNKAARAKGLSNYLHLSRGARVLLCRNQIVKYGLANGTLGTVVDIIYEDRNDPSQYILPLAVMVKLEDYNGPSPFDDNIIPFSPMDVIIETTSGSAIGKRTQIPLALAWGMTIHKAQGKTMNKLVVILENCKRMETVLVALSRVRQADDMLVKPFSRAKWEKWLETAANPNSVFQQRLTEENRLKALWRRTQRQISHL